LILAAVALPGTGETVKARGTIKFTAYLLGFVGAALLWRHWLGESVSDFSQPLILAETLSPLAWRRWKACC
jgi:hypothetical protein